MTDKKYYTSNEIAAFLLNKMNEESLHAKTANNFRSCKHLCQHMNSQELESISNEIIANVCRSYRAYELREKISEESGSELPNLTSVSKMKKELEDLPKIQKDTVFKDLKMIYGYFVASFRNRVTRLYNKSNDRTVVSYSIYDFMSSAYEQKVSQVALSSIVTKERYDELLRKITSMLRFCKSEESQAKLVTAQNAIRIMHDGGSFLLARENLQKTEEELISSFKHLTRMLKSRAA